MLESCSFLILTGGNVDQEIFEDVLAGRL